jgi:hypothetical protein
MLDFFQERERPEILAWKEGIFDRIAGKIELNFLWDGALVKAKTLSAEEREDGIHHTLQVLHVYKGKTTLLGQTIRALSNSRSYCGSMGDCPYPKFRPPLAEGEIGIWFVKREYGEYWGLSPYMGRLSDEYPFELPVLERDDRFQEIEEMATAIEDVTTTLLERGMPSPDAEGELTVQILREKYGDSESPNIQRLIQYAEIQLKGGVKEYLLEKMIQKRNRAKTHSQDVPEERDSGTPGKEEHH